MNNKSLLRNLIILVILGLISGFLLPFFWSIGLSGVLKSLDEFLMNKGVHLGIVSMNITSILSLFLFIKCTEEVKKELQEEEFSEGHLRLLINGMFPFGMIAPMFFLIMGIRRMSVDNLTLWIIALILFILHMIFLVTMFYKAIQIKTKVSGKRPTNILSLRFNKEWEKTADERERLELYREGFYGFKSLLNSLFVLGIFYGLMSIYDQYEVLLLFFILISITIGVFSSTLPKKK